VQTIKRVCTLQVGCCWAPGSGARTAFVGLLRLTRPCARYNDGHILPVTVGQVTHRLSARHSTAPDVRGERKSSRMLPRVAATDPLASSATKKQGRAESLGWRMSKSGAAAADEASQWYRQPPRGYLLKIMSPYARIRGSSQSRAVLRTSILVCFALRPWLGTLDQLGHRHVQLLRPTRKSPCRVVR
jgi:hypothetical protein